MKTRIANEKLQNDRGGKNVKLYQNLKPMYLGHNLFSKEPLCRMILKEGDFEDADRRP